MRLFATTFPIVKFEDWIEQKGMTFDHDFDYYFPPFSSLLKNEGLKKEND